MKLSALLKGVEILEIHADMDMEIHHIANDSR